MMKALRTRSRVLVLAAITSSMFAGACGTSSNSALGSTSTTTTVIDSTTQPTTTTTTTTTSLATNLVGVGRRGRVGQLMILVHGFYDPLSPGLSQCFLAAGRHCVAVDIDVTNIDPQLGQIFDEAAVLRDTTTQKTYQAEASFADAASVILAPGQTVRALLEFQVPDGSAAFQLEFPYEGSAAAKFRLTPTNRTPFTAPTSRAGNGKDTLTGRMNTRLVFARTHFYATVTRLIDPAVLYQYGSLDRPFPSACRFVAVHVTASDPRNARYPVFYGYLLNARQVAYPGMDWRTLRGPQWFGAPDFSGRRTATFYMVFTVPRADHGPFRILLENSRRDQYDEFVVPLRSAG